MEIDECNPPRVFRVGNKVQIEMFDCGKVALQPDEQVTFTTESGGQYDVARKDWGFYATPSLNGRLSEFGLRAVLVKNTRTKRYFLLLVEAGKEGTFKEYLVQESCLIVHWLDTTENLEAFCANLI